MYELDMWFRDHGLDARVLALRLTDDGKKYEVLVSLPAVGRVTIVPDVQLGDTDRLAVRLLRALERVRRGAPCSEVKSVVPDVTQRGRLAL